MSLKSDAYMAKRKVASRAKREEKAKAGVYDSAGTRAWPKKVPKARKAKNENRGHGPGEEPEMDQQSLIEEIKGAGGGGLTAFGARGADYSRSSTGVPASPYAGLSSLAARQLWKRRRAQGIIEPMP